MTDSDASRHRLAEPRQQSSSSGESADETLSMLDELEIHQTEPEVQHDELRRTQEELAASRAHYFELFDLAPVGYLTLDANALILEANFAAANLVGVDRCRLIGRSLASFIFPDDRDVFYRHHQRLSGTHEADACELRLQSRAAVLSWVRLQSVPVQSGDGAQIFRVTLSDITERKQAEEASRRHEELFHEAVENMLDGFAILSAIRDDNDTIIDFRLEYINEMGCQMSQRTGPELIGHTLLELRPSIKQSSRFRDYVLVVKTGQPLVAETLNSEEGWLAIERTDGVFDMQAVRSGDGFAIVWREVTQQKHAEMQLLRAKEAAEEAKREQQELRRIAELQRRSAESLAKILAALNANEPFEEIMKFTAGQARQLLGSQAVAVYHTNQQGELVMAAADGLPSELTAGVAGSLSIVTEAIAARQPIALRSVEPKREGAAGRAPEALTHASWTSPDSPYRAVLTAPVQTENDTYGAILFHYLEPRTFSTDEVELAADFGSQIALALKNARLREELRRAAITAERSRLARDLHDAVTQTLFSASIMAEAIPRVWDRHPQEGRAALEELRELTRGALAEMRTLIFELRPDAMEEKPMGELLRHLTTAISRQIKVPIRLSVAGDDALPTTVKIALYRIAQEALNNVARHAKASDVAVELQCHAEQVVLQINDDGLGFDRRRIGPGHLGLDIMGERAASIGATLQINSRSGAGTEVVVRCLVRDGVPGAQPVVPDRMEKDENGSQHGHTGVSATDNSNTHGSTAGP